MPSGETATSSIGGRCGLKALARGWLLQVQRMSKESRRLCSEEHRDGQGGAKTGSSVRRGGEGPRVVGTPEPPRG